MTGALRSMRTGAVQALLKGAVAALGGPALRGLLRAAARPLAAQERALRRILAANAATAFGRRHDFGAIRTVADFRRATQVQTYEDLRPDIERQEATGEPCLTVARPVFYYRTSGTTGQPKNIPVTQVGLRRMLVHQRIAACAQARVANVLRGSVLAIAGAAVEGHMPGGTPFGSASGLLYENVSRWIRSRYALPPSLSGIADYEKRYLAMAVCGAAAADVSCIATPNPSTLVRLLSVINRNGAAIAEAVASGAPERAAGPEARGLVTLPPDRERGRALERLFAGGRPVGLADLWPGLAGIVTWTGGSCAVPLQALRESLPPAVRIIELGYLASEARLTINVDPARGACLPTLTDNVFEFAERAAWEAGSSQPLSLHELEPGAEYYIFVTTPDGLYRYDMNDIVRVDGRVAETPTLRFVQKGKGVTSITGEKLSEPQVLDAVAAVSGRLGVRAPFFLMLADQATAGYTLYLEGSAASEEELPRGLADALDAHLRVLNVEYDGKRASGRLSPTRVLWLRPGAGEAYRDTMVANGQRDAQFKAQHLQFAHECKFDVVAWTRPEAR